VRRAERHSRIDSVTLTRPAASVSATVTRLAAVVEQQIEMAQQPARFIPLKSQRLKAARARSSRPRC
jgi:hypothetical protein